MYYVFSPDKFKTKQGLPNGHLFGLCQNIRTMDKLGYEIFLCEDSKCEWRRELNEDYKANRQPSEGGTEFWKDYPKIRDLISNMSHAHSLASSGFEADDIMYSAAKICSRNNIKCKVFTMDKDLLQALDENIDIVHKVTLKENEEIKYDSPEYWEKFPVKPELLPYFRAFKGDSSDNLIAPVKRFPKDLAIELSQYLKDNGSLKDYNITNVLYHNNCRCAIQNKAITALNFDKTLCSIKNMSLYENTKRFHTTMEPLCFYLLFSGAIISPVLSHSSY